MAKLSAKLTQKQKPLISIQSWKSSAPPNPKSSKSVIPKAFTNRVTGNVTVRVKTDLYQVTDTCTNSAPSTISQSKSWKEKCAKSSSTPSKAQTMSPLKSQLQSKLFNSPKVGHHDRLGYSTPNRIQGNVTSRVKTELCPVIEVCTAATLPVSSPKSQSKSTKEKFEERIKKSALTPSKMLPITPMKAQIKQQPFDSKNYHQNSTSLMSADMQRVKVEIGRSSSPSYGQSLIPRPQHIPSPHSQLANFGYQHHLATTPSKDQSKTPDRQHPNVTNRVKYEIGREYSPNPHQGQLPPSALRFPFASPQKRFLDELDNNSPVAKRHRLSLDSRIGMESRRTVASPFPPSALSMQQQQQHPHLSAIHQRLSESPVGNQQPRRSSFSIDSIISKTDSRDYSSDRATPCSPRPVKPPTSQSETSSRITVPITPYTMRGIDQPGSLDPRLAHLAGIAANPHLGLSQISYGMNPFYAQYLAMASQLSAPPGKFYFQFYF